jgi:hypothetical protein
VLATVLGAGCGGQSTSTAPASKTDGGAATGTVGLASLDGGAFDGLVIACDPTMSGGCGKGACRLTCGAGILTSVCGAVGAKKPGELCGGDEECEAGAQCFHLACGAGAAIGTCLRVCMNDSECGGTACSTPVPCGGPGTPYKTCARGCDPLGEGKTGCAEGLRCFVFANEVPDCDCPGTTHVKPLGAACAGNEECAAGLHCVEASGARSCRPLCRLADAPSTCPAGTTCTRLIEPTYRYQTFGACVSP